MESIIKVNKLKKCFYTANQVVRHLSSDDGTRKLSTSPKLQLRPQLQTPWDTPHLLTPLYMRAGEFRKKVALWDNDGSFLYEDIFRRSLDLAIGLRDVLPDSPTPHRIGFLCPNGVSYVITQWACWMGGFVGVPLAKESDEATLEFQINDAKCSLVVATQGLVDKVFTVCERSQKKLISLDSTWTAKPVKEFDTSLPMPTHECIANNQNVWNNTAMILYTAAHRSGHPRQVPLTHYELNCQLETVTTSWNLDEKCSMLHSIPLVSPYAIVTALMAPMSVGGKVVMLSQFDTVKVWTHLLGINTTGSNPIPKVNHFLSIPRHYIKLLERYDQIFENKKARDYVRMTCRKRLRAMVTSGDPVSLSLRQAWKKATGHNLIDCYTTAEAGTLLSEKIEGALEDDVNPKNQPNMEIMSKVETKVVRNRYKSSSMEILDYNGQSSGTCVGKLMVKSPGMSRQVQEENGWIYTGDNVKMARGKFEVIHEKNY